MKKFYLLFVFLFAFTINCSEKKNLSPEYLELREQYDKRYK